ncbi:MAG: hypothetical protein CNLJKLNK_01325 [Holosporales bacterium]
MGIIYFKRDILFCIVTHDVQFCTHSWSTHMLKIIEKLDHQPVTLEAVKAHLRIEEAYDDDYLLHLIETATAYVEQHTNRFLLTKKIHYIGQAKQHHDGAFCLHLPGGCIQNILSVYAVFDHTHRQLIKRFYIRDADIAAKLMLYGKSDIYEVTYTCGYGDHSCHIPAPLRHAILLVIADLYENRGNEQFAQSDFFKGLIAPFTIKVL